jgi:hypothetical protein
MKSVFAWEIASIKSQIDQSTPLSCLLVAIERRSELEEVPSSMDSSWRKSDAPRKKWLTKAAVMARDPSRLSLGCLTRQISSLITTMYGDVGNKLVSSTLLVPSPASIN